MLRIHVRLILMSTSLAWLQSWYRQQCNGRWEFEHLISITSDEPGWCVKIDFGQTGLSAETFEPISFDRGDNEWMNCAVEGNSFYGTGDPLRLEAILDEFYRWASSQSAKPTR